jgi:hypothetical protein
MVLQGFAQMYDIGELYEIELPTQPDESDTVGRILYGFNFAGVMLARVFSIPVNAFITLSMVANSYPSIAIFILFPAILTFLVVIIGIVRIIRGSG